MSSRPPGCSATRPPSPRGSAAGRPAMLARRRGRRWRRNPRSASSRHPVALGDELGHRALLALARRLGRAGLDRCRRGHGAGWRLRRHRPAPRPGAAAPRAAPAAPTASTAASPTRASSAARREQTQRGSDPRIRLHRWFPSSTSSVCAGSALRRPAASARGSTDGELGYGSGQSAGCLETWQRDALRGNCCGATVGIIGKFHYYVNMFSHFP